MMSLNVRANHSKKTCVLALLSALLKFVPREGTATNRHPVSHQNELFIQPSAYEAWFVFSIYLSKTSNSQPLNVTHGWMIDGVFQQHSVPLSNCYKHSHLGTTNSNRSFFFTEELYWSNRSWSWQCEMQTRVISQGLGFKLANIWTCPSWSP